MNTYDFDLDVPADSGSEWIDERSREIGREIGFRAIAEMVYSARFEYRHKTGRALKYWTRVYILDRLEQMAVAEVGYPDEYSGAQEMRA